MANIIPFDTTGKNVPAYLKSFTAEATNDLAAHHTITFPVISIKGKVWTIKRGGEKFVIPNPKDPESPATSISVVILKANPKKSKVWYASGYQDNGEEGKKPDCFSRDSDKPDPESESPQAKSCAVCKHNQWGSKINEKGVATKGKSCQDTVRLAIATPDRLNDPHLLRVPPASIKAMAEYGEMLAKRGVPPEAVVTKLRFDPEEATPSIQFTPEGFLDEAQFAEAREIAGTELVENILGTAFVPGLDDEPPAEQKAAAPKAPKPTPKPAVEISDDKTVTPDEVKAAVEAGKKGEPVVEAKKVAKEEPQEEAAETAEAGAIEVDGIPDLSKISFDD
jgi:hypothetical protein